MNILAEKHTGMGEKWVLVQYEDDSFAYGFEHDLHMGFPIDQRGTRKEVLSHCKLIAELCKKNIANYQKVLERKPNSEGWRFLIEYEQKELDMLTEFASILSN